MSAYLQSFAFTKSCHSDVTSRKRAAMIRRMVLRTKNRNLDGSSVPLENILFILVDTDGKVLDRDYWLFICSAKLVNFPLLKEC